MQPGTATHLLHPSNLIAAAKGSKLAIEAIAPLSLAYFQRHEALGEPSPSRGLDSPLLYTP